MLKTVLWIAAACAVLLLALALTRGARFTSEPTAKAPAEVTAPAAEEQATPAAATAPEPASPAPPPPPIDDQVAEDAAAVGMTTREPQDETAPEASPREPAADPAP